MTCHRDGGSDDGGVTDVVAATVKMSLTHHCYENHFLERGREELEFGH